MQMPDPDNEHRSLPVDMFLSTINDNVKKKSYKALLSTLKPFSERIRAKWRTPDGMPDVRIITNAPANATELLCVVKRTCHAPGES